MADHSGVLQCYKRRWFVIVWSCFELILFSGPVFGWSELVIILRREGFYSSLCKEGSSNSSSSEKQNNGCSEQEERLNLVFTVALLVTFCFSNILIGLCFDKLRTRKTRCLGSFIFALSGICMILSQTHHENFIFPGVALLQVAGFVILLTAFQIGNLSEQFGNTIIAVLNGAFDTSSVVFTFIKIINFSDVPLIYIYIGYFSMAVFSTLLFNFCMLPRDSIPPYNVIKRLTELHPNQSDDLGNNMAGRGEEPSAPNNDQPDENTSQIFPPGTPLRKLVTSRFYVLHVICFAIIHLRIWVYIGSLNDYLEYMSDHDQDKVQFYTDLFGFIQFSAVVINLMSGIAMDFIVKKTKSRMLSFSVMFFVTISMGILLSVVNIVPMLKIQIISFVAFPVIRGIIYSIYGGAITLMMPHEKMGILYTIGNMLGSWFASSQYLLFILIKRLLKGNPLWVNVGLLVLMILAYCHPFSMFSYYRRSPTKQLEATEKRPLLLCSKKINT